MTEAYLGNPNLYKANLQQSYTEEQVREIAKCMEDPIHFIKEYTRIKTTWYNSSDKPMTDPFTMG